MKRTSGSISWIALFGSSQVAAGFERKLAGALRRSGKLISTIRCL